LFLSDSILATISLPSKVAKSKDEKKCVASKTSALSWVAFTNAVVFSKNSSAVLTKDLETLRRATLLYFFCT